MAKYRTARKWLMVLWLLNMAALLWASYAVFDQSVFLAIFCFCLGVIMSIAIFILMPLWKKSPIFLGTLGVSSLVLCAFLYLSMGFDCVSLCQQMNAFAGFFAG